ncbi:oligopeptide/dipeptide ABC transporter ATP-binding protein [Pseudonocardia zijingensis]|jgi:oligopeptide/dipeptide ABC transporter ATP-binding protein|uniref:Dipeptide ABC transporter ATP-binding protein n=1 Tax=Pseudonocardia zijingensis TaxID=153376 RepID=A0ABN1PY23_9PSEU
MRAVLAPEPVTDDDVVVKARGLHRSFPVGRRLPGRRRERVHAVDGVDVTIPRGRTVGVIGESGSGKTTLGRAIARLTTVDSGAIEIAGRDVAKVRGRELKQLRRSVQVVFQDPFSALDPTKTIAHALFEPILVHGLRGGRRPADIAAELLTRVGLHPSLAPRYPAELSGGQRQRVCIARALALGPEILIADEPTSALDLSTRSEILNLLVSLQEETGLSILLISHDVATIRHLSHEVLVMYMGRVVESGPAAEVMTDPRHPYTEALLSAAPIPDPQRQRLRQRIVLHGEMPSPVHPPQGCNFSTRCPLVVDACRTMDPPLVSVAGARQVACIRRDGEGRHVDR